MTSCTDCKFAVFTDYGYSNWTVEGTDFNCSNKLHPDGVFDRFYKQNAKLNYAEQCSGFTSGEAIHMDVDCEGIDDLTDEQKQIYGRI